jgi:hypothetical protein
MGMPDDGRGVVDHRVVRQEDAEEGLDVVAVVGGRAGAERRIESALLLQQLPPEGHVPSSPQIPDAERKERLVGRRVEQIVDPGVESPGAPSEALHPTLRRRLERAGQRHSGGRADALVASERGDQSHQPMAVHLDVVVREDDDLACGFAQALVARVRETGFRLAHNPHPHVPIEFGRRQADGRVRL